MGEDTSGDTENNVEGISLIEGGSLRDRRDRSLMVDEGGDSQGRWKSPGAEIVFFSIFIGV